MAFDRARYSAAIVDLLPWERLNEVGPGRENTAAQSALAALTPESVVAPHPVRDRDMAQACLAGLWLAHDFLDRSHSISQEIETTTGSYWHGIMHRREGDFSNAKYWFRRVGRHPVFEPLGVAAAELAAASQAGQAADALRDQSEWDPYLFVDLCERARGEPATWDELCRRVQRREWELLFDYCYAQASGR
ncbi:MAG: hypothetical protein AB7O59_06555 [Pirellulales bacterium]